MITRDVALMSGGCAAQGGFLSDTHLLHLPTLMWLPSPTIHGSPGRAASSAGHTCHNSIMFGGIQPSWNGVSESWCST
jgi:hypothetical protein